MTWKASLGVGPFLIVILCGIIHFSYQSSLRMEKRSQSSEKKMGFATLATPAFAMGAVTLGYTLRKYHGDKYGYLCMVTPDVNETWREILSQWWTVAEVKEFKPYSGFRRSWTKLRLWTFTEYSKLVYIDTDILILGDLSELFSYSQLSCVGDIQPPQICNTGVLVLEPKEGMFEEMKDAIYTKKLFHGTGDQGFINSFFGHFTPLPSKYNVPRTAGSGLGWHMSQNLTKAVHFVCKKPWKCGREGISYCGCGYPSLNTLWWNTWDEACEGKKCMETWKE